MKLKKGDTVQVIAGKDKLDKDGQPRRGTVLQVLPGSDKVIVSGVNTASKHMKPGRRHRNRQAPQQGDKGGIIDIDMPIHVSNVMFVHKGKPVRIGYDVGNDGKKVRVAKLGGGKTEVIS